MFESIVFLHSIVILVTSNPLQGFQSCPVIQYQQNYRNSQKPVIIQPSDYKNYLQQYSVLQQLAPHSVSSSNDDYSNQWYLNNNLLSQRASPVPDPNVGVYDRNGLDYLWYGFNPGDTSSSTIKKYSIVPQDTVFNNQTISTNERHNKKHSENRKTVFAKSNDKTKHNKKVKRKRKNNRKTKDAVLLEDFNTKTVKQDGNKMEDDNKNQQSSNDTKEPVKKRRRKNNIQNLSVVDKTENIGENKTGVDEKNMKRQKMTKPKNLKNSKLESEDVETATQRAKKKSKFRTIKNNNLVATEDITNDENHIEQINTCFDMNEDCVGLENRKVRNYNNGNKNFQQPFLYMPFDYSMNNIASYINNLMSNPQFNAQIFDTNGNFYYNFDHLYQFPQFQQLTMPYEKRQDTNKRTSTKRKKKKSSKDNSNKNSNSSQNCSKDCIETIEISPKFVEVEMNGEQYNENVVTQSVKKEIKATHQDEESFSHEKSQIDSNLIPEIKEPILQSKIDSNSQVVCEDVIPFINDNGQMDEYYPDFTADALYLSKENNDWDSFYDRHYYFSEDINKIDRTKDKKNYENKNIFCMDNHKHEQIVQEFSKENTQNSKISETSAEKIKFKIPPRLEHPDFQTKKINKDKTDIRPEVHYDPRKEDTNTVKFEISNEDINFDINPRETKLKNKQLDDSIEEMYSESSNKIQEIKEYPGKLSTHSNVKTKASDVNQNNKREQNNVETIFVQSKVVKYGPSQEENDHSLPESNESNENQTEDKNLISHDGDTYIVIAKSWVNDFYH